MGIAFASYLDSCRDNLERVEVGTRLGIVLSFLFGGQELIQKAAVRLFDKMVPDVLRPDRSVKPLTEIATLAIQRGGGDMAKTAKAFLPMLMAKEALFFIPMAICIVLPGIILGKLNQYWTAKRFDANKNALGYRVPYPNRLNDKSSLQPTFQAYAPQAPMTYTSGMAANRPQYAPQYGFYGRQPNLTL